MFDNQGENFKNYLIKKGLNNTQAAEMMGVSSEQINNYCNTNRFQRKTLKKLQYIFIDFLLKDIETPIIKHKQQNTGIDKDREIEYLKKALKDKEKIIELLETQIIKKSPNEDFNADIGAVQGELKTNI